jgi:hypothetical protein
MFNRDKVTKYTYGAPVQILANVEFQYSVGCIVPQSIGVNVTSNGVTRKIAKAGTPININLDNINAAVTAATTTANAVLLHNVDVTEGAANGTALIWGFVNKNRVESDVLTKINAVTDSGMVTFLKV